MPLCFLMWSQNVTRYLCSWDICRNTYFLCFFGFSSMRNTSGHMILVYLDMSKKGLQFMYCGKKFPNKECGLALNFLGTLKLLVNNGKLSLLNLNHHHLALLAPCSPHSDSTTHATAPILFAMASRPSLLHFYALCVLFQYLGDAQIWKYCW